MSVRIVVELRPIAELRTCESPALICQPLSGMRTDVQRHCIIQYSVLAHTTETDSDSSGMSYPKVIHCIANYKIVKLGSSYSLLNFPLFSKCFSR